MEQNSYEIAGNVRLSESIYRLEIEAASLASASSPGQFVMLKTSENRLDPLLRRPFSVHNVTASGEVHIAYKVLGKGTQLMSRMAVGDSIDVVGPLGKGFTLQESEHFIVGGGMGIAPMKFLTDKICEKFGKEKVHLLLGARNRDELEAFKDYYSSVGGLDLHLATDDGSAAHKGFVTDLLKSAGDTYGSGNRTVYCCGPHPMMKAVALMANDLGWKCQVSLETMMACGISACLGCTVESTKENSKGGNYLHVCQDGPVFNKDDIKW